jgi:hypothetical protein
MEMIMSKYTTTVREGEKLSDIANRFTGNPSLWYMIVDLNNHLPKVAVRYGNVNVITLASLTAGQKLFIPSSWVNRSGSVGVGKTVQCPPGYVYNAKMGTCMPQSVGVGKTIQCPPGYVYNAKMGVCMPVSNSGTVGGCSSCGSSKCNSCGGGCEYPYGNRNSQSAPCGAFGNDLGSCGRMRTDAYLTGTVGADPTKTTVPTPAIDQAKNIANLPPEQCVKKVSEFYPYIKSDDEIYPMLVSRFGSDEEVKSRFDIMAQTACNIERKDINVQPFYSKPVNWLWMGGALIAGVIVGKAVL